MKPGSHPRKSVRLDRPAGSSADDRETPGVAPAQSPERGGLLARIRETIQSSRTQRERRESIRHPAVDPSVWVGWWDGDDFGVVEGQVINLSRGGALVWIDLRPPGREPIWFYKESGEVLATVRGYVVRSGVSPQGGYAVRFRFVTSCPTLFFQAALCKQPPSSSLGRSRIVPPS